MRKLLLALLLCSAGTAAQAQNVTCPNRPGTDSSNACANTRFVQTAPISPEKLPTPTLSTLGAVYAFNGTTSQWPWQLNADGTFTLKQPEVADIAYAPSIYISAYTKDNACATDATAQLQAAINAAQAFPNGASVVFDKGKYCFSTLTVSGSNIKLRGNGTQLLQNSTTANGLVLGDGVSIIDNVEVNDITIWTKPGTVKTGGASLLAYYARNLKLINVNVGTNNLLTAASGIPQTYNGIVLAGFAAVTADSVNIIGARNECLLIYALPNTPQGSPLTDFGAEFHWVGGGQIVQCGSNGIHIGGGAGGVSFESGGIASAAGWGVYIDRSLDPLANANGQIWFGHGFSVDTNVLGGIYFGNASFGQASIKGWVASNSGPGIDSDATQNAGATVIIDGAQILYNHSHGVAAQGGSWTIGGGTLFYQNGLSSPGGSGVLAYGSGVVSVLVGNARFDSNGSGGAGYGVDDQANAGVTQIAPGATYAGNTSGAWRSINGLSGVGWPGVSGAIPYWSDTGTVKPSALLTSNRLMIGGGAGSPPATLGSAGTTTTVLHGNASGAPTFGAVALADIATIGTNTLLGNATSGSAVPSALSMPSCSTSGSAIQWTTNTGFGCNTSINAATLNGATFASPGAIGGTAASSAAFTTFMTTGKGSVATITQNGQFSIGANSAANAAIDIQDANTGGQEWKIGPGVGTGSAAEFNFYNATSSTVLAKLSSAGALTLAAGITTGSTTLHSTSVSLTNGAGSGAGTITNAPAAGNPTKWVPINDNGTTRYIPAW